MSFRSAFPLPAILWLSIAIAHPAAAADVEPPAAEPAPKQSPKLTQDQEMQVQFQIMAGEMAAGRGQPGLAAEAFVRALEIQPDAALASRTTQLALSGGNLAVAQKAARRWLELEPTSLDAREILARLALHDGDTEEVYAQSLEIVRGHAGGPTEGFRHVALLLSSEPGRGPQVLEVFERLIAVYPRLSGARYARALVALRYESLELAESSAREALKLEPASNDYALLLVGVLVRRGQIEESDALIKGLLGKAKGDARGEVRMTYARLLLDAGQRDSARSQIAAALKENQKNHDARYALGVMAFSDGDLDQAETLFTPLVSDSERGGDASYQLGRIAESRKQYDKALEHYRRVSSGSQAIEAAVRQAAVMTQLGQVDEARASLDQLRRQFPPLGPRLTLAEAEMLMDAGRNDDALSVYNKALERDAEDSTLLYGRSLVFERMGRFPDSEKDLRSILEHDPEDPRALNALGYMLAVNTDRYEEAQRLIDAALQRTPDDAAVIDSMGWVLFKRGHAAEARGYLQKALDKAHDPEISAHLGEVLWTLGEKDQARAVWDKASARAPGNAVLRETVERLTH